MYIVTGIHVKSYKVNSILLSNDNKKEALSIFLEYISEHCYNNYKFRLNKKFQEILQNNKFIINDGYYLDVSVKDDEEIQIMLYQKTIDLGYIFNTTSYDVSSIFHINFCKELDSSVKTTEYINIQ